MKKITTIFAAVVMVMMFTVSAYAGPIDWLMDKVGYTPTSVYELQKAETTKALLAAKTATDAATKLATVANFQSKVIDYGGLLVIVAGGLAFFKRKDIAKWTPFEKKPGAIPTRVNA